MKDVSSHLLPFLLVLALSGSPAAAPVAGAGVDAPASAELTQLLHEFLQAASVNDKAVFEKFFADDVIYTRSAGVTISKPDIMRSFDRRPGDSEAQHAADRAQSEYGADQITVHQYGDAAIVNFRLIANSKAGNVPATQYYRNTGTFVRRDGRWQAVAWQSTKAAEAQASAGK